MRKARELLAFLAVHPDGASGEAISEALWPEVRPRPRRRAAQPRAAQGPGDAPHRYRPARPDVDYQRIRALPPRPGPDRHRLPGVQRRPRRGPQRQRRGAAGRDFRRAAALYRGELAEGAGYQFRPRSAPDRPTPPHGRLNRHRRDPSSQPTPAKALSALETALAHNPYNEYLYVRIMRLQAAAGRPEAVGRTLALLESKLTDLGITPSSQTRQAAAAMLAAAGPWPGLAGSADA